MSFAQGYADVSNRFRDLQLRDTQDALTSAGNIEKVRQAQIMRQMPQGQMFPEPAAPVATQQPAPAATTPNVGASSRAAHSALQSKKAPLPQDRSIEISEASNRLQAKKRADSQAQQDRRSMLTAPAAISDVLASPFNAAWNVAQGVGAVGRDIINRGANVVAGRDAYNTDNRGNYVTMTPFTDEHIRKPVQGMDNDAATLKRLQGADQSRIAEMQGATRTSVQTPTGAPAATDFISRIRQAESAGNPNAVGRYIPGQGTAKGDMQVMDATAAAPGLGVVPARDNSPEERSRVGRDYAQALLQRYGNEAEAAAAYNWGFGNYDRWKAAGGDVSKMPAETRAYVAKVTGGAPQGAPQTAAAPQPGQPQQAGGYSPEQMAQLAQQRVTQGQQQLDYLRQLAQVTRDPAQLEKLRTAYSTVQSGMQEAQLYNMAAEGRITPQQFQQLSETFRAQQAARAQKAYEAQLKTQGELAVEGAKGANAMQLEQLRGTERRMAVIEEARNQGYKVTGSPDGNTYATRGQEVYVIKPDGTAVPVKMAAGNQAAVQDFMSQ